MLGSKLNVAAGASSATIAGAIAEADAFLTVHDHSAWSSLSEEDQAEVLSWKDVLDEYNNRRVGPSHCD